MYKLASLLCLMIVATVVVALGAASRSSSQIPRPDVLASEIVSDVSLSDQVDSDRTTANTTDTNVIESDSISLPPTRQTFTNGDYRLVITAADQGRTVQGQTDQSQTDQGQNQWHTESAIAQLYRNNTLQWEQAIPHAYGPRYAVLSSDGQTLLLDEFINVASPHAITLLAKTGEQVAQYSFEAVETAIGLPAADIMQQATSGWWISMPPELSALEDRVFIQTGGRYLTVELLTGELTVSPIKPQ